MKNKTSCKSLLSRPCEYIVDKQNDPLAGQTAPFKKTHITYPRNVGGPQGSGIWRWSEQQTPDRNPRGKMDRGFTLIELLVVVLIIGILASIALPQYQKAVEKSKATQALTVLKSLVQAQKTYFMANGAYAKHFDELSVELPYRGNEQWANVSAIRDTRSNEDWSLQLWVTSQGAAAIYMGRLSGKYKGAGFVYKWGGGSAQITCAERRSGGVVFEEPSGSYCQKIMGGTQTDAASGTMRSYLLP